MAGDVFLQAERAEPGPLIRRGIQGTDLAEFAFLEWSFEKMARQDRETVEELSPDTIRLGELRDDLVCASDFSNGDRLVPDDPGDRALRGVGIFVEIDAE